MKTVLKTILGFVLLPFVGLYWVVKAAHWSGSYFCAALANAWSDDGIR